MGRKPNPPEDTNLGGEPHKHIWGKWFPWDRNHVWRQCVLPLCREKEIKEASA